MFLHIMVVNHAFSCRTDANKKRTHSWHFPWRNFNPRCTLCASFHLSLAWQTNLPQTTLWFPHYKRHLTEWLERKRSPAADWYFRLEWGVHLKGEGTNPPSQQHIDARILSQNWFLFSLSHLHGTHMTEKKLPNTVSDHFNRVSNLWKHQWQEGWC